MTNEQKLREAFVMWLDTYAAAKDYQRPGLLEAFRAGAALSQPPTSDEGTPLCDSMSVLARPMTEGEPIQEMLRFRDAQTLERTLHAKERELAAPIEMLLFCPQCDYQHVDEPQPHKDWTNPPHRSHQCQKCGHIWRPCDRSTNGVAEIATKGQHDLSADPATLPSVSAAPQEHKPNCPAIPDDPFGHPPVVGECTCAAPPQEGKADELDIEAQEQLTKVRKGDINGVRWMIDAAIDYHHAMEAQADALGYDECVPWHEQKRKEIEALLAPPPATPRGDGGEAEQAFADHFGYPHAEVTKSDWLMFRTGYRLGAAAPQSGKKEEWISVDVIPDRAGFYLVYAPAFPDEIATMRFGLGHWYYMDGEPLITRKGEFAITHWMPLPSPPASKAEGE